ncbi:MAG: minichromosome maintenance protein MCM [Nitrososphaerota archaeon]|nr:minichromosome maintenance protein MCM [Nitrososphaerota archaeon]
MSGPGDVSPSSRFGEFLRTCRGHGGEMKYRERAAGMAASGGRSLLVDFADLASFDAGLSAELVMKPDEVLEAFRRSVYDLLAVENRSYASQTGVGRELRVRLSGVENHVSLRGLGKEWLNRMVSVGGTIVRSSNVEARMVEAVYACASGHLNLLDVDGEDDALQKKPTTCEACDEKFRFELLPRRCRFVDYQLMRLQESPEELPPGQIPAYFDVMFAGDLVNVVRPGDRVAVTAVLRAVPNAFRKSKVYDYRLEANHAEVVGKEPEVALAKEDEEKLRAIAALPDAYERLVASVAPTILGHEREKEAILLLLAGAPAFRTPDGTKLRGDVNILLVGDPGISKSMLLKFAAGIAPRGVYTSGRGSSAAGLTAAVVKEKDSYTLEIGAAILADLGVLAADEFDKMKPEDRSALHEVLEQGTTTISKAGIHAVLNARIAMLAAMNPVKGLYDPHVSFSENVPFGLVPPALLSRMDLIFVMRDASSEEDDRRLAQHVMVLRDSGEYPVAPPIDPTTLKKYLIFCKRFRPRTSAAVRSLLEEFYVTLRKASYAEGGIGATPRTLEAMIRLSQARARLMLREEVVEEDARAAIRLMQGMFDQILTDPQTGKKLDFGQVEGKTARQMGALDAAMAALKGLEGPEKKPFTHQDARDALTKTGKFASQEDAEKTIKMLLREGFLYEARPGCFKLT